ncbi:Protein CBG05863 [Caenorhabditis briggsae]|uniref:Protein CBG05863 n=1 Tax=Caenorhabditis briggsae TaxID=6238 RepID=A8X1G6_CAEBR|nr:Protein CBG05863 [Caenorhabditis briggsae]CAP26476.2 Protein CBG05863 [Caenorhabditis briggsae]
MSTFVPFQSAQVYEERLKGSSTTEGQGWVRMDHEDNSEEDKAPFGSQPITLLSIKNYPDMTVRAKAKLPCGHSLSRRHLGSEPLSVSETRKTVKQRKKKKHFNTQTLLKRNPALTEKVPCCVLHQFRITNTHVLFSSELNSSINFYTFCSYFSYISRHFGTPGYLIQVRGDGIEQSCLPTGKKKREKESEESFHAEETDSEIESSSSLNLEAGSCCDEKGTCSSSIPAVVSHIFRSVHRCLTHCPIHSLNSPLSPHSIQFLRDREKLPSRRFLLPRPILSGYRFPPHTELVVPRRLDNQMTTHDIIYSEHPLSLFPHSFNSPIPADCNEDECPSVIRDLDRVVWHVSANPIFDRLDQMAVELRTVMDLKPTFLRFFTHPRVVIFSRVGSKNSLEKTVAEGKEKRPFYCQLSCVALFALPKMMRDALLWSKEVSSSDRRQTDTHPKNWGGKNAETGKPRRQKSL